MQDMKMTDHQNCKTWKWRTKCVGHTEQDISAPPFRRHRLGATVSALTVSALGLLGAGTSRHRPFRRRPFRRRTRMRRRRHPRSLTGTMLPPTRRSIAKEVGLSVSVRGWYENVSHSFVFVLLIVVSCLQTSSLFCSFRSRRIELWHWQKKIYIINCLISLLA